MISNLALALTLAAVNAAHAGVYIETAERDKDKVVGTQKTWVQGGKMRVESAKSISIWKDDAFTILDPRKKTYTVMDRAAMKAMGERMNGAMAQLANMPPEQRAMVERMMGGGGPGQKPALKIEVVDTRRSETVDGRSCRLWDMKVNGAMKQRSCAVGYALLPGHEDLQALFRQMASFMEEMRKAMPQMEMELDTSDTARMNGYPVLTRDYANGKPNGKERRLVAWREEAVAAAKFDVPAGYKKREMAEARGR
jgi:hypothetical protein